MKRRNFLKGLFASTAVVAVAPVVALKAIAEPLPIKVPFVAHVEFPRVHSAMISTMRPDCFPLDTILREMGSVVPEKEWRNEYY